MVNNKYGRLVIVSRIPGCQRGVGIKYKCLCDCGEEKIICGRHIRSGRIKSCGCWAKESTTIRFKKSPYYHLYTVLCRMAKYRKITCVLSFVEFVELTQISECHYCGSSITWKKHSEEGISGPYNLDRKNNDGGYSKENCVVCCGSCNHIKSNKFSYEEMISIGKTLRGIYEQRRKL